jgi:hypothetical protein
LNRQWLAITFIQTPQKCILVLTVIPVVGLVKDEDKIDGGVDTKRNVMESQNKRLVEESRSEA